MPDLLPSPDRVTAAAANLVDVVVRGGVADLRRTPARVLDDDGRRTLLEALRPTAGGRRRTPVLLVPPLGAPLACFDLRRGCSLVEHLVALGHPTYLLDGRPPLPGGRAAASRRWVLEVLPEAIAHASDHAGGAAVQLVGWSTGGVGAVLAAAGDPALPVAGVTAIASPFDAPRHRRARRPAPPRQVGRALAAAAALHDRDALAQVEAVARLTDAMRAQERRAPAHEAQQLLRLAGPVRGRSAADLAALRVPVLAIAGATDGVAPEACVHHVAALLPRSRRVQLETCPGGHLGVLAGRAARRTTWRRLAEFIAAGEPAARRRRLHVVS